MRHPHHYASPALVDAFGLDEYGNPHGMGEVWGAVIGAGAGFVGSSATKHLAPLLNASGGVNGWQIHAEGVGLGAAALLSGALMIPSSTRRAAWIGLLVAAVANGSRWVDDMITAYVLAPSAATAPAATPATSGIGMMTMQQQVPALGAALIQQQQPLQGLAAGPELFQGLKSDFSGLTHQLGQAPQVIDYGSHFGVTAMANR